MSKTTAEESGSTKNQCEGASVKVLWKQFLVCCSFDLSVSTNNLTVENICTAPVCPFAP